VPQGAFLRTLGIETRARMLAQHKSSLIAAEIDAGLHRLIDAEQMGNLFKVIAMSPQAVTGLAGFA
jgi:SAM-dependent MidA family methyltransferase